MVWTDQGIQWLTNTVIELAGINAYTASRLLNTFQQVRRLKPDLQNKVKSALAEIVDKVPRISARQSTNRPSRIWRKPRKSPGVTKACHCERSEAISGR